MAAEEPQGDPPQTDRVYWPTGRPRTRRERQTLGSCDHTWPYLVARWLGPVADRAGWKVLAVTGRAASAADPQGIGVAVYLSTRRGRTVCLTCDEHLLPAQNLAVVCRSLRRLTRVLRESGPGMAALLAGLEATPPNWSGAGQEVPPDPVGEVRRVAQEAKRRIEEQMRREAEARRQAAQDEARRQEEELFRFWSATTGGAYGDFFGFNRRGYTPPPPPPPPPKAGPGWWAVLGVDPGAGPATVQRAYRKLTLELHPDRGGDAEKMKAVNAAWTEYQQTRRK